MKILEMKRISSASGGFTLLEIDSASAFGWERSTASEKRFRYLLPDMLVDEDFFIDLAEVDASSMPLAGILRHAPALDRIYADECSKHDARIALPLNYYELPLPEWRDEAKALGAVEFTIGYVIGELRSSDGRCKFHLNGTPEDLRLAIRNALRNITGQKLARLSRPQKFTGPEMTTTASWILERMRPYAASVFERWIERALSQGMHDKPLVLLQHDVAGPCDRAELRFCKNRLSCTINTGPYRLCDEVLTAEAVSTSEIDERRGAMASSICSHPLLKGRQITGTRNTNTRAIHSLSETEILPLSIKVEPVLFSDKEAEDLVENALSHFDEITAVARLSLSRMEISERVSRITKVASRKISETPWQDLKTHNLRLVVRKAKLDCDGPLSQGVFWSKGALRIEGLPQSALISATKNAKGQLLNHLVSIPGLEDAAITSATIAPPGKRRPEQLVVRAA